MEMKHDVAIADLKQAICDLNQAQEDSFAVLFGPAQLLSHPDSAILQEYPVGVFHTPLEVVWY